MKNDICALVRVLVRVAAIDSLILGMVTLHAVPASANSGHIREAQVPFTAANCGLPGVIVTWNPPFADTNYAAVCTVETVPSDFLLPVIQLRSASSMVVNPEGLGPAGTLHCIAIPDSDSNDVRHSRVSFSSGGTVTVPWNPSFPDTNYTATCTLENAGQLQHTSVINSILPGSLAVTDVPSGATMHCIAIPDSDSSDIRHSRVSVSGGPSTVPIPWNPPFSDANYTAACSDVLLGAASSDSAIAIDANSRVADSMTVIPEILAGTVHCIAVPSVQASPFTGTFALGDVIASTGDGMLDVFKPDGTILGTLNTTQIQDAGMVFDKLGNLYVTDFGGETVSKFDVNGHLLGTFGSGYNADPESILQNLAGNFFVGQADGTHEVLEFDPNGNSVMTFSPAVESRGTDWIELLADQKTLLYTSEGVLVKSFNISTNTQNADFATGLPGFAAYALRQLPDGTVLVADTSEVVRLSSAGSIIQTYTPSVAPQALFALNLDPDGVSFWTADLSNGNIFRFNIASGAQLASFSAFGKIVSGLAIFGEKAPGTNNLTVTLAGTGSGTVTSNPAGITCGSVCTAPFPTGSSVTLTAAAATGSTFSGWSGNSACTGTGTCTLTMNGDQSVTATFNVTTFMLSVADAGTGSGTVTSSPTGINCSTGTCAAMFASGTVVNLAATAATGSTFAGWSGACTGTSACSVTMNANQTVTATFTTTFTLSVMEAGMGSGTVTSPGGINCPGTCSASFASGTVVNLTATAATGSTFAGWSGACTGTGACNVTMNSNRAVTATFNVTTFMLSVTDAGTGSGTVTSSPTGINCSTGTCSASFASGTMVMLTANAATGSTFVGWSGACTGTGTCTVTMSSNQSVTASFNGANFTLTTAPGGGTTATVHPGDTAVFPLTLTPVGGFTGTVMLSCASQQATITCSVSPTTVNLVAGGTAAAITVDTFCAWLGPRSGPPDGMPGPWLPSLGALMALALIVVVTGLGRRELRPTFAVAALALFAMLGAGCASLQHGPAGATPPGTYNLVITASAPKSAPQTIPLTLKVI